MRVAPRAGEAGVGVPSDWSSLTERVPGSGWSRGPHAYLVPFDELTPAPQGLHHGGRLQLQRVDAGLGARHGRARGGSGTHGALTETDGAAAPTARPASAPRRQYPAARPPVCPGPTRASAGPGRGGDGAGPPGPRPLPPRRTRPPRVGSPWRPGRRLQPEQGLGQGHANRSGALLQGSAGPDSSGLWWKEGAGGRRGCWGAAGGTGCRGRCLRRSGISPLRFLSDGGCNTTGELDLGRGSPQSPVAHPLLPHLAECRKSFSRPPLPWLRLTHSSAARSPLPGST